VFVSLYTFAFSEVKANVALLAFESDSILMFAVETLEVEWFGGHYKKDYC
jgi:hypothetical protein